MQKKPVHGAALAATGRRAAARPATAQRAAVCRRRTALDDVQRSCFLILFASVSGLITCVTHRAQDMRDTSLSAGGVERGRAAVSSRAAGAVRGYTEIARSAAKPIARFNLREPSINGRSHRSGRAVFLTGAGLGFYQALLHHGFMV